MLGREAWKQYGGEEDWRGEGRIREEMRGKEKRGEEKRGERRVSGIKYPENTKRMK